MTKSNILIVEDDLIIGNEIKHMLEDMGYAVMSFVNSGENAIQKIEQCRPDLILMDIQLKGRMDGIEAAQIIRSRSGIPIIFLTAYADQEKIDRAKVTMPCGYIIKPFQESELHVAIEMAMYAGKIDGERKIAEKALRESEQHLRTITDELPVLIAYIDSNQIYRFVNKRYERSFNLSSSQLLGKTVKDILGEKNYRKIESKVKAVLSGEWVSFEEVITLKNQERNFYIKYTPHTDEDGKNQGYFVLAEDITERKISEQQKMDLEIQLQQAQKMEAIGLLAGGIAHDFNNILFPIIGYTEMALEDVSENSPVYNKLKSIHKAASRAKDLVMQILTLSRKSAHELTPLSIQPIIKEALKLIRSTLPTGIQIRQNIASECRMTLADPVHIHQILMNLCTNAFHAMQETGGTLDVKLSETIIGHDEVIRFNKIKPGTYLLLTVSDTGHGMDSDVIKRIFDPYFTTKETGKGTGLGLSVVHGIVTGYGGAIQVFSQHGKGSEFHIYLPCIDVKPDIPVQEKHKSVPRGVGRILLVDDELEIVEMENQKLVKLGYMVTPRTSSIEALEAFRFQPENFDLIITDLNMPNMSGLQLAQKIKEIRPDIPIILCTGYDEKLFAQKAEAVGIHKILTKPVAMNELAKSIRDVIK